MHEVSLVRLYVLRATYLLVGVGVAAMIWPHLLNSPQTVEHYHGVTWCLLTAVSLLGFLGIRYPLKMLPVLFFELVWKVIWVVAIGLPLRSAGPLVGDFAETWTNTVVGIVVVLIAIPWGYVFRQYVKEPGERWR
ncbi:MAG: hypothetical protein ABJC19_07515 [Gemmatimonadota bacterium]